VLGYGLGLVFSNTVRIVFPNQHAVSGILCQELGVLAQPLWKQQICAKAQQTATICYTGTTRCTVTT